MENIVLAQAEYKPTIVHTTYDAGPSGFEQALSDPSFFLLGGIFIVLIVLAWGYFRKKN